MGKGTRLQTVNLRLVEWLKRYKALSSNPSAAKKKKSKSEESI
jgi:hypothetical protein